MATILITWLYKKSRVVCYDIIFKRTASREAAICHHSRQSYTKGLQVSNVLFMERGNYSRLGAHTRHVI